MFDSVLMEAKSSHIILQCIKSKKLLRPKYLNYNIAYKIYQQLNEDL